MIIIETNQYRGTVYKIFIIEDSEADLELYKHFLHKDEIYYYTVNHVETGAKALEFLLTNKPDLILIDFSLPDMDGLQLIEILKKIKTLKSVPMIMLTGMGNPSIALQAMKKNIQDYLIKDDLDYHKFINTVYQSISLFESQQMNFDKNTFNILIVDDSEADLELYKRFLTKDQDFDFNIYEANTVKEALNIYQNTSIDLILTDYQLPDRNGLDLIKYVKKVNQSEHICIIMMTGQGSENLVVDAIKHGASDYLVKNTITPETLQKNVKDNLTKNQLLAKIKKNQFQQNLLSKISLNIRQSIDLEDVIQTSVSEIKNFLECDRVLIYKLDQEGAGKVIGEAVNKPFTPLLNLNIVDTFFKSQKNRDDYIFNCRKHIINNITEANIDSCHRELLESFQVKSIIAIPIIIEKRSKSLWGLFIAHFCEDYHYWEQNEIAFLNEITLQVSIGIEQGLLVQELKKERDRANAATQSKSVFLANMSHEIRTPMNGILGLTEILSLSDLSEEQKENVNMIQSSGESLLNLINEILDLSKLEAGKIQLENIEFDLEKITKEILYLFQITKQQKNIELDLILAKDLPRKYRGDPYRLKQVLINLIGNAIKFTTEGAVTINIEKYHNNDANLKDNEIILYFSIKDTGIGIPKEKQSLLFQQFSQMDNSTTRNYGGTGLGLSVCKQLVELMEGDIGVKSEINQGSTFWFTAKFQSVNEKDELLSNNQALQKDITQKIYKPGKILLVEDNRINQKVLKQQLKSIGYQCYIVNNGQEALERITEEKYDLIFMDCQMPVLDGYDATRAIRQKETTKDIIIIGLSASAMKEDQEKCLDIGMNDYCSKPCSVNKLKTILNQWL